MQKIQFKPKETISLILLVALVMTAAVLINGQAKASSESKDTLDDIIKQAKLVFSSGFEGSVRLAKPRVNKSRIWVQSLIGADSKTGFKWPEDLPGKNPSNDFWYEVSGNSNLPDFIDTRIDSVIGPYGTKTKALYQEIKKDDPNFRHLSRNAYLLFNAKEEDVLKECYVRYWIKLQPNLKEIMPKNSWRMVMEWREQEDKYHTMLVITRPAENNNKPTWVLKAHIGTRGRRPTDWHIFNKEIPVPLGQWFLLEAYWKHSESPDGRYIIRVNKKVIFNYRGRNKIKNKNKSWHIFKIYTPVEALKLGPAYQWIDDVEIYAF